MVETYLSNLVVFPAVDLDDLLIALVVSLSLLVMVVKRLVKLVLQEVDPDPVYCG